MVSGGNIDINLLDRIIGYGLAKAAASYAFTSTCTTGPANCRNCLP